MARYKCIGLAALLLALAACERPAPPAPGSTTDAPFDLTAYLQAQTQRLQAGQPMVLKSVKTGNQPTETIETDAIDWEDELAVFEEADLNRPTLQENYTRSQETLADGSLSVQYDKLPGTEPLVHHLHLVLTPANQLRQMEALLQDRNLLFFTQRRIMLSADSATGNISGYNISGVQKLIFSDSLRYSIDANL